MAHARKKVVDYPEEDALNIYIDGSMLPGPAAASRQVPGSHYRDSRKKSVMVAPGASASVDAI